MHCLDVVTSMYLFSSLSILGRLFCIIPHYIPPLTCRIPYPLSSLSLPLHPLSLSLSLHPLSPPAPLLDIAEEEGSDSTRAAATITGAILGFKVLGPIGALAGATFANHYGKRHYICIA